MWRFINRCKGINRNSRKWQINAIWLLFFMSGSYISWYTFSIVVNFFNTFLVILFQLLIFFNEIWYLLFKSGDLILVKDFFSQLILRLKSLFIKVFFVSKREHNSQHLLKVLSFAFVQLINSWCDILIIIIFKVRTKVSIDNLIEFVLVVKINAVSGQIAVDILIKVFKLLNYTLYAKRYLLGKIRRGWGLIKHIVNVIELCFDIMFLRRQFFFNSFHFLLFLRTDLFFSMNCLSIKKL